MTHYNTLGVSETATPEEIKKAYRKLASQHHPDKGGDTAMFQQVEEAYRVLSDPQQRQQYDFEQQGGGTRHFNFGNFDGNDLNDIFSRFGMHFGPGFSQPRQPRRNKDLRIELALDLASTLEKQTKTISVQTTNGQRQTLDVDIPKGVATGASIRYPGLGDNFFTSLPRGDLYVNFRILPNPEFQVFGIDLITNLDINPFEAILGCEKTVTGLDSKNFLFNVPAGVQHGGKLRLNGQGLWDMHQPIRGNLIVNISIITPTKLSNEQLDLVRQIQNQL